MFPFITKVWNPLGGECLHKCVYCWAKLIAKRFAMKKYSGKPHLSLKELKRVFTAEDFVFVCDMCDLFGWWVPSWMIQRILDRIAMSQATFLLLTKNPKRYLEFDIPENCVRGATIENDFDDYHKSAAPNKHDRFEAMWTLQHKRKMLAIEPILQFCENNFFEWILKVKPKFVAVGYDNYGNHLPEPSLEQTLRLIRGLESEGITVFRKTLREAWNGSV
jgi:DNA repair photolyase